MNESEKRHPSLRIILSESGISELQAVFFILAALFCFLTMFYNDMTITSQYGVVFLDSLFDGKPLSFYANCVAANVTPEGAVYDIGIYILFGIWSIPVWLLHHLAGLPVLHPICMLWYKILVFIALAADGRFVYRLALKSGLAKEKASAASLFFILTPFTFFPVSVAIQYDVIVLFFMLWGIDAFLNDRYRLFLLLFAISLTMKPFPAFVLGTLILIRQKNILKIIRDVAAGASLMAVCKVIYFFGPASYRETNGSFLMGKFGRLFTTQITEGIIVPLFILALAAFYFYLWRRKDFGTDTYYVRQVLFLSGFSMALFCILADIFPYWAVYFAPFSVLFLFWAEKDRAVFAADLLANVSVLGVFIYKYYWVYGGSETYASLLLKPLWNSYGMAEKNTTVGGGLGRLGLGYAVIPLFLLFAFCEVFIIIQTINALKKRSTAAEAVPEDGLRGSRHINVMHVHITLRILLIYLFIALTFMALIMQR